MMEISSKTTQLTVTYVQLHLTVIMHSEETSLLVEISVEWKHYPLILFVSC